jgi:hypothetical protein
MIMIVPDQFIDIRVAYDDFASVTSQQHGNVGVGEAMAQRGKHRKCEDNIAKAVGADYKNSVDGVGRIDSM